MTPSFRALLVSALIASGACAHAELRPELPPLPSGPVSVESPAVPAPTPPTPAPLAGATATLTVPRTVSGPLPLTITLRSLAASPVVLAVRRENTQNCAFGPHVRVVRVGTQEVVYPVPGASRRLCTQEIVTKSTASTGAVSFSRELKVPPGEYMVESWLTGLAHGVLVKVPATPIRVTVK